VLRAYALEELVKQSSSPLCIISSRLSILGKLTSGLETLQRLGVSYYSLGKQIGLMSNGIPFYGSRAGAEVGLLECGSPARMRLGISETDDSGGGDSVGKIVQFGDSSSVSSARSSIAVDSSASSSATNACSPSRSANIRASTNASAGATSMPTNSKIKSYSIQVDLTPCVLGVRDVQAQKEALMSIDNTESVTPIGYKGRKHALDIELTSISCSTEQALNTPHIPNTLTTPRTLHTSQIFEDDITFEVAIAVTSSKDNNNNENNSTNDENNEDPFYEVCYIGTSLTFIQSEFVRVSSHLLAPSNYICP
jgi:hypothetical protein